MKKMTCAVLTVLSLSSNIKAANITAETKKENNTSAATIKDYYQQLKDSPFGLTYLVDTYGTKIGKATSENLFYIDYKLDNNKFSVIPDFVVSNAGDSASRSLDYDHTQFRYTRYNLLTEEENGVKLDAQMRAYILNDTQSKAGTDTILRPYAEISKNFGNFKLLNANSLYLYQTNKNADLGKASVKTARLLVQVTPSYKVTDKFTVSSDFFYYGETFNKGDNRSYVRVAPTVNYNFDNGIGLYGYLSSVPLDSKGKTAISVADSWIPNTEIGATLIYSLF